jgi:hypothetical protein
MASRWLHSAAGTAALCSQLFPLCFEYLAMFAGDEMRSHQQWADARDADAMQHVATKG